MTNNITYNLKQYVLSRSTNLSTVYEAKLMGFFLLTHLVYYSTLFLQNYFIFSFYLEVDFIQAFDIEEVFAQSNYE